MRRITKGRVLKGLKITVFAILMLVMLLVLVPLVLPHFGWQADPILTGSMEPDLKVGGLAVTRWVDPYEDSIQEGDILVYRHLVDGRRVSHRVVGIEYIGLQPNFETKGDANEDPDPYTVYPSYVEGVVKYHIPYLGYFTDFAKTRLGLLLLLVLPGVIIIGVELREIWITLSRAEKSKTEIERKAVHHIEQ